MFEKSAKRTAHLATEPAVWLREFFVRAANIHIAAPEKLFTPDARTRVFAQGLQKLNFAGKSILEVGVGNGIHMAGLMTSHPQQRRPARYVGVDISQEAIWVSFKLARRLHVRHETHMVRSNLLGNKQVRQLATQVDDIIASIPQIPRDIDLSLGDNAAHYYRPKNDDHKKWDQWGLGLNARLLHQARSIAPQADVTLNLGGQSGFARLAALFTEHGYQLPRIAAQARVLQHQEVSLASLATQESAGTAPFEFFNDAGQSISATEAEALRRQDELVRYNTYVMNASPA